MGTGVPESANHSVISDLVPKGTETFSLDLNGSRRVIDKGRKDGKGALCLDTRGWTDNCLTSGEIADSGLSRLVFA